MKISAPSSARLLFLLAAVALAGGCSTTSQPPARRAAVSGGSEHGYYKIGKPYQIDGVTYTPAEDWTYDETGIASWYGPNFHGKITANGELYDMTQVTAAHKTLPMPSLVRVTNLENGRTIIVRVNDRGPYARGRILDMSRRGAQLLGYEKTGTAKVRVQIMAAESRALAEAARQGQLAVDVAGIDPDQPPPPPSTTPSYTRTPSPAAPTAPPAQVAEAEAVPPAIVVVDEKKLIQEEVPNGAKGEDIGGRFFPTPQVTSVQKVRSSTIYVQAGAFGVMENAERMRTRLGQVGKIDISPTLVNGRTFYRVRVGPVASVDEADRLLAKVVAAGGSEAKIVVN
jgi:rare lipoprotein A